MMNPENITFQGADSIGTSGKITWDISMKDFQKGVISGEYRSGDTVKDIRDTIGIVRKCGQDIEKYKKYKATLPGICSQARFNPIKGYPKGRRKKEYFDRFTNVVVIDIDKKKNINKIKAQVIDQLGKFSYVIALSPGNNGLHIYLRAEVKEEADITKILESVQSVIKMKVDTATKDCTRYMFLTWDPLAYINESPEIYKIPPSAVRTLLQPADKFYDIETLMAKKKFLGKVRCTDNIIWKAFLVLAKSFEREYIDRYLSGEDRRKALFHPDSKTINNLEKIKTNLDNAYDKAATKQQGIGNYFKTNTGIWMEYENAWGEKGIQTVNTTMFLMEYDEYAFKKLRKYYLFESIANNYPNIKGVEFTPCREGVYNLYYPLKHQPNPGSWDHIRIIFEHFTKDPTGEIYEKTGEIYDQTHDMYDYIKLLLTKPSQILPIPVLISTERETGKTTLLNFFKELLDPNGVIISMQHFANRFNSSYATKSLVAIDESKLDKRELEKIKSLSTAKEITCEFKGRNAYQIRNTQHYILASNSFDFTYYDKVENRFWCFLFPKIEKRIPDLFNKLVEEIPAFIHYLLFEHVPNYSELPGRAVIKNSVVTHIFRYVLYEQTKNPALTLLSLYARSWFAANQWEKELRFSGEKVHRCFRLSMPISAFRDILMNESWISKYGNEQKMQYHIRLFNSPYDMKPLPDEDKFPTELSEKNDRPKGLFYIKREKLINPEDDKQSHDPEDDKQSHDEDENNKPF